MGSGIGLTTAIGTGIETTYGTGVTPDRWYEFDSETLDRKNEVVPSQSLRSGTRNLRRGSRRVVAANSGMGDIVMPVATTGMGRLLNMALGGTSTIVQDGATPSYLQTHNMGSTQGKSQTIQKQIRDASNTVLQAFTFWGSKITTVEFKITKKGLLVATFGVDAKAVDTATAAATPAYTTTKVFHFAQGVITVAGTAVGIVSDASVKLDNKLNVDRLFLGSAGQKSEPIEDDYPNLTGQLSAEFDSAATFYNRFAADSAASLALSFTGAIIPGSTFPEGFTITIPEVHFTGEAPKVSGPKVIVSNIPFDGQYDGTDPGMTIQYRSSDTAI